MTPADFPESPDSSDSSVLPTERAGSTGPATRRRRRRASSRQQQTTPAQADAGAAAAPERPRRQPAVAKHPEKPRDPDRPNVAGAEAGQLGQHRDSERGWRELAGNAPSQVGPQGAMRARDLNRPTAEDLEAAEREVVIVRRQWQPPEARPNR